MKFIRKWIDILRRPFARRALYLQSGTVAAMLVQAVAGVILARLLGPHEYGRYAIIMSMAAIGSTLLGAGAADAMAPVLSRAHHSGDDAGVRSAVLFLGKFVLATAVIVFILGFSMPLLAEHFYGDSLLGWCGFAVLMASAISTVLFAPTQLALQVYERIGQLSVVSFSDQAVRQAFVVAFAFAGFGVVGVSLGHAAGAVVMLLMSGAFWWRLRGSWSQLPSVRALWSDAPTNGGAYIRPTLWVLADRNLAMLYGAAPIALAGAFLTATDVSYFKIALGWITLALAVLSPISVLLNTELARIQVRQPHALRHRFMQITTVAVVASTSVTLVAALFARPVFGVLYGAQYLAAVPLVYWMVPFGALFGLGVALGPMWRAVDKVRTSIVINVCVLSVGVPAALFAMRHWGVLGAVAMVTVWYTASHSISLVYVMRMLRGEAGR